MDSSMSWITFALSTADQRVDSGVNQLLPAAVSSTAVMPLTKVDRPVLFGTSPLWPSSPSYWVPVSSRIHCVASSACRLAVGTTRLEPPRNTGIGPAAPGIGNTPSPSPTVGYFLAT